MVLPHTQWPFGIEPAQSPKQGELKGTRRTSVQVSQRRHTRDKWEQDREGAVSGSQEEELNEEPSNGVVALCRNVGLREPTSKPKTSRSCQEGELASAPEKGCQLRG